MAEQCNKGCGVEIGFRQENGRWIPTNADGTEHRTTCSAQRGLVREALKRPQGHHVSQSRIKRFLECQRRSFFVDVQGQEDNSTSPEMIAGKLVHACLEFAAVERSKANDLARAVEQPELLAALEVVVGREQWTPDGLALARAIVAKMQPVDLSFAWRDEHGIAAERQFTLPCGDGVIVGGIVDLIEKVGEDFILTDWKSGARRDEAPEKSPQAAIYLAWGRAAFGPRVRFALRYLALEGPPDEVMWTPELEDYGKALARAMVTKARTRREDESAWPATPGAWCRSCPFTSKCEAWQARMASTDPGTIPADLAGIAEQLHVWEPIASIAKSRVDDLRSAGKELAAAELGTDRGTLLAGRFPVKLKTYQKRGYEVKPSSVTLLEIGDPLPLLETTPALSPLGQFAGCLSDVPETEAELLAALKEPLPTVLGVPIRDTPEAHAFVERVDRAARFVAEAQMGVLPDPNAPVLPTRAEILAAIERAGAQPLDLEPPFSVLTKAGTFVPSTPEGEVLPPRVSGKHWARAEGDPCMACGSDGKGGVGAPVTEKERATAVLNREAHGWLASRATCTPACWARVECSVCRKTKAPRGRSVALETLAGYCLDAETCPGYGLGQRAPHLWDEHDNDRAWTDPEGWKAHEAACERCRPEKTEASPGEPSSTTPAAPTGSSSQAPGVAEVLKTARLYQDPTAETLEAMKDVERTPETLAVVALAKTLETNARPCRRGHESWQRHRWRVDNPNVCLRCGSTDRRDKFKKIVTASASLVEGAAVAPQTAAAAPSPYTDSPTGPTTPPVVVPEAPPARTDPSPPSAPAGSSTSDPIAEAMASLGPGSEGLRDDSRRRL